MDVDRLSTREIVAELPDRLEEGQALDVADRAADLDQHEVEALVAGGHELLDGVGDVRDHLDGGAEIVAPPFLGDDVEIDAARRDVVGLRRRHAGEALVMAEVEVGLGPVVGDEDLAVLVGAHRPRIDVEIGVELAKPDLVAAGLEERAKGRRRQALAERRHHAAGDEYVPRHGPRSIKQASPIRKRTGSLDCHPQKKRAGTNPALVTGFRPLTATEAPAARRPGGRSLERDARCRRGRRRSAAGRRPGPLALHALKLLEDARPLPGRRLLARRSGRGRAVEYGARRAAVIRHQGEAQARHERTKLREWRSRG